MKIAIRDKEALSAILPGDAALYLRSRGWRQTRNEPGRASVWMLTQDNEEYEALLLLDVELGDYALRMGELLQVLAITENRSQLLIYSDLLMVNSDVVRIRLIDNDLLDGTLPIEEHASIAQRVRDLVLAAACATLQRRPVWHARKPAQAVDFVRRVRIGPSERGSYTMTINSRVTPRLQEQQPGVEMEEPFERQAMQRLAGSLLALHRAAERAALTQEMAGFDQAITDGVNANLCDAVVGLWGGESHRSLEFSFSWSPARTPVQEPIRRVAFSPDRRAIIQAAGSQMREREPVEDFELRGPVVRLERSDGARTGKVTVMGLVEGRQVRVMLELAELAYNLAVDAHRLGQTIRTCGTLSKEGRGLVLAATGTFLVEEEAGAGC